MSGRFIYPILPKITAGLAVIVLAVALYSPQAAGKDAASSLHVNLQDFPLYLKHGFTSADVTNPDVHDGAWLEKNPFSTVIIGRSGLPGLPQRTFLSPFGLPDQEFTFVIPFIMTGLDSLPSSTVPTLFLAGIGDNWEVFLNGTLIKSEMHLAAGSLRILEHHSERNVFFPMPREYFREGRNILAFRIVGDPGDQTLGFQYSGPYYIADYDYVARKNDEMVTMVLVGGYLLAGIYHLLLFAIRRKDRHYLFCGLFAALMGSYYLLRTQGIYHFIPDTAIVVKLEFFCVFLVLPALGAFSETLCRGKTSLTTKIYSAAFAFLALSQLLFPRPYGSDCLIVWQLAGIAAILYILIDNVLLSFITTVKAERRQCLQQGTRAPGLAYFLADTYTGNLLIAVGFIVPSSIADILDSLLFHHSLNINRYFLYLFILMVTLMLARTYGRLNYALQAKSAFLANMSHEIRTPMNVVMGMTEQILRDNPPVGVRDKAGRIKRAGAVLISIINDILDFSRIEAGKMLIVNGEYRIRPLLDEVTDALEPELKGKVVRLVVEIDPAIPEFLVGDALRIRQILSNLLLNAVKFTRQGVISLRVRRVERDKQLAIEFVVEDTGTGIRREDLGRIFTEFHSFDPLGTMNADGTGLGLTICQKLCRLMDAEIRVRSEFGKGSAFTVIMPQKAGIGEKTTKPERKATLLERGIAMPAVRALIVDDLADNRQILSGFLRFYGITADTAASGREALDRAAIAEYDIVFMDQVMDGEMDGVATMHALRKLRGWADIPVVALTAHAVTGMREFFIENGFQDYVAKPLDLEALDAVIDKWAPHDKRRQNAIVGNAAAQEAPELPGAVKIEMALQQVNLLKHYRWHFESGLATDGAYCGKFAALLESLRKTLPEAPADVAKDMADLAGAGWRGDVTRIREGLPDLCLALTNVLRRPESGKQEEPGGGNGDNGLDNLFCRLGDALDADDREGIDVLMAELRGLSWPDALDGEARELYFFLYDSLMMGETERAAGALAAWRRIFNSRRDGAGGKE